MESTQPILRCRYSYDPLDRLISQLQPDAPAHQRFYCKSRLSTETQGAIGYSIFQKDDLLLAQHKRQNNATESTLLATDLQRSVLRILNSDVQHPIAYSPYGHCRAESGLISLLGFNGERPDPVTGCYLLGNGYRAFNPVLMRFNSPDSFSPFGKGGLNGYAYCAGDPANRADPTGHALIKPFANTTAKLTKRPLQKVTITELHNTKYSLGGTKKIRAMAAMFNTTPETILVENTIQRSISKINSAFARFENPQITITNRGQIQSITDSAKNHIEKHRGIIEDLKFRRKINNNLESNLHNTIIKSGRFFTSASTRIHNSRVLRLMQDGVIDYTPGDPPIYHDELFPIKPSGSNNLIRRN
jgi:RHS repeat-associated protein